MTRRRGRRRSGPPRCSTCGRPITWLRLRGSWRTFEPRPVAHGTPTTGAVYPVEGRSAWPTAELIEELMGRRQITEEAAREEVYDLEWYVRHACPPSTDTEEPPST